MRLKKLALQLRVTGVTDPVRSVDENGVDIRPVRIVAIGALLLLERRMQLRELLPFRLGLRMTLEAQLSVYGSEEGFMLRAMGCMAGEAASFTLDGIMLEGDARACVLMTGEAELVPRLHEQRRLLGGVRVVALEACPFLEGFMLKNASATQVIRIVTLEAELSVRLRRLESVGIGRRVVTRFALGPHHRIMGAGL